MSETNDDNEKVIFHAARAIGDAVQRETYLAAACRDAPDLRSRVDSLLAAMDHAGNFLGGGRIDRFDAAMGMRTSQSPGN